MTVSIDVYECQQITKPFFNVGESFINLSKKENFEIVQLVCIKKCLDYLSSFDETLSTSRTFLITSMYRNKVSCFKPPSSGPGQWFKPIKMHHYCEKAVQEQGSIFTEKFQ